MDSLALCNVMLNVISYVPLNFNEAIIVGAIHLLMRLMKKIHSLTPFKPSNFCQALYKVKTPTTNSHFVVVIYFCSFYNLAKNLKAHLVRVFEQ